MIKMEDNTETFTEIIRAQISMLERDIIVKEQEVVDMKRQLEALKNQILN